MNLKSFSIILISFISSFLFHEIYFFYVILLLKYKKCFFFYFLALSYTIIFISYTWKKIRLFMKKLVFKFKKINKNSLKKLI